MNFHQAYLRAAAAATAVVLSAGGVAVIIGLLADPRPIPLPEILSIPFIALLATVYAFVLTLVAGTLGHWLLRRFNCRARSHYIVRGAVFGWVTPWFLFGRPDDWRWILLAGAVFAAAGAVAASTFWKLHVLNGPSDR